MLLNITSLFKVLSEEILYIIAVEGDEKRQDINLKVHKYCHYQAVTIPITLNKT